MNKPFRITFHRILQTLFLTVFVLCTLVSCTEKQQARIVIGYQYGVAYAPLLIMKEQNLLEQYLPGTEVEWQQCGGPTPIREGMLNGSITFGFMGISPVLIGIDNGMPWKYLTALSANRVAVITNRPDFQTLQDLRDDERIAILSPGCTQHILLSLLAKQQLGDARCLDNRLVSLSHPDAMNALLSGTEIAVHVTTPPYLEEELQQGMYLMAEGDDIMGEPFTFICGVAMTDYVSEHEAETTAFLSALSEAIDYINRDTLRACEELAPAFQIEPEALYEQMTYNGTIYSMELKGISAMNRAMAETGFISRVAEEDELCFSLPHGNMP